MNTREVLIVEDKEGYRNSIKRAFREERYRFFEASKVEDGIALLEQHPSIRVIILDLSFPENSGVKLLEWVRPHAPKYKVIVLTGHEELLKAENAADFEVFYYQAKAAKFSVQSIRFAIDHAFNDMESELLNKKISMHLEVQEKKIGRASCRERVFAIV
jgi:DNA-binding NtrC family response regulator